jgi:hypothetical protein
MTSAPYRPHVAKKAQSIDNNIRQSLIERRTMPGRQEVIKRKALKPETKRLGEAANQTPLIPATSR